MIIGLTGQTGSGKSTLCKYLEAHGFFVASCDEIAKEVRSDKTVALKIAEVFGEDIIGADGAVNRQLLAERAFKSKETVERLNKIMHPEILSRAFKRIHEALESGFEFALLDAPQLFESGAQKDCDLVVCVIADKDKRLERILKRDGISLKEAEKRIGVQYDDDFYTERADFVILNNGDTFPAQKADELIALVRRLSECRL